MVDQNYESNHQWISFDGNSLGIIFAQYLRCSISLLWQSYIHLNNEYWTYYALHQCDYTTTPSYNKLCIGIIQIIQLEEIRLLGISSSIISEICSSTLKTEETYVLEWIFKSIQIHIRKPMLYAVIATEPKSSNGIMV